MTSKKDKKLSDETRFFNALSEVVGFKYLQSKSINKPINSKHVFLSNNYSDYLFKEEITDCYIQILTSLKSNYNFSSDSLSQFVDGMVLNHPVLKNRIIEFDEEQHFTPARLETFNYLNKIVSTPYITTYKKICSEKDYLNEFVLKKHRVKNKIEKLPKSFIEFTEWLEDSKEKSSNYISSKNGFDFLGGRIAQRAYYDCLRDTAHLSDKNKELCTPIRFSKKEFEDKSNVIFSKISNEKLKEIIIEILKVDYGINL